MDPYDTFYIVAAAGAACGLLCYAAICCGACTRLLIPRNEPIMNREDCERFISCCKRLIFLKGLKTSPKNTAKSRDPNEATPIFGDMQNFSTT